MDRHHAQAEKMDRIAAEFSTILWRIAKEGLGFVEEELKIAIDEVESDLQYDVNKVCINRIDNYSYRDLVCLCRILYVMV